MTKGSLNASVLNRHLLVVFVSFKRACRQENQTHTAATKTQEQQSFDKVTLVSARKE
jgi:hypothetical protein